MASFFVDSGIVTRTFPAIWPLRMRVSMSAMGSCMLMFVYP